jgi:hypothetical protein
LVKLSPICRAFYFPFLLIGCALILAGCAQQSSPTGGDKDTLPPQVLNSSPKPFSTNFQGNEIELEFDEYIQVKDFSSQLIVSPSLENQPEYKIRGKKLIVSWEDSLAANTTYQFNFGKSVVDLNEGNVKTDMVFVFSTGPHLDSLTIQGQVIQVADNTPLEECAVMIYQNNIDSLPLTTPPQYFAITDANGFFKLRYLPEGDYKIFGLKEDNNNYIYDGPPESIAFQDSLESATLNDSVPQVLLASFIEQDTSQYIATTNSTDYGYYELIFNVPTKDLSIEFFELPGEQKIESRSFLNTRKDTLKNWVRLPDRDNLEEVLVVVNDPESYNDSLYWYIETDPKFKQKAELKISSNTTREKIDLNQEFTLDFNNPIVEADTSLVYFLEDSVQVYPNKFERSGINRKIKVHYDFKKESDYIFKASPGAFKDVFGAYNDSISIPFTLQEADYYGHLSVDINIPDNLNKPGPKILQLLNKDNAVLEELTFDQSISKEFRQLDPDEYRLKVIFDTNGNGKWDTGNYSKHVQPEKVSYYPEEIKIRSNWEFEVEWVPSTPFD